MSRREDLQRELDELENAYVKKRGEYADLQWFSYKLAIVSIAIFVVTFGILFYVMGGELSKLGSKEFINNELATAFAIAAALSLMPTIIAICANSAKIEQKNAQLGALASEVSAMRHRIIAEEYNRLWDRNENNNRDRK